MGSCDDYNQYYNDIIDSDGNLVTAKCFNGREIYLAQKAFKVNNFKDYNNVGYYAWIDTNFKDRLQRFFHQNGWQHPFFEDISSEVVNNKKLFTVAVLNGNVEISRAQETSKKKAEQKASMLALLKYGQLYSDQIVEEFD